MLKKIFITALFAYNIILFQGCASMIDKSKPAENAGVLEPQAALKLGDVPIPAGFKLIPQESYSFESSGVRVGFLKYQGKADPEQVVNFYKEQMAMYNWNLLNIVEYGSRLLNFDRESETCIINLITRGSNVAFTISIGPKSQTASLKKTKPIK